MMIIDHTKLPEKYNKLHWICLNKFFCTNLFSIKLILAQRKKVYTCLYELTIISQPFSFESNYESKYDKRNAAVASHSPSQLQSVVDHFSNAYTDFRITITHKKKQKSEHKR